MLSHKISCFAFALTLSLGFGSTPAGETASGVPLEQAVLEFNAEWEAARIEVREPRLTSEEIIAAIRHEGKKMSNEAADIALQIVKTGTLPQGAKLSLSRRLFSNQTMSYVWTIKLSIENTWDSPATLATDVADSAEHRGTPVESLVVRKRYLASQPRRTTEELKSLDELLSQTVR